MPKKKLIEVALPLEAINIASAREKSIRHGHPSTLHLWWARRPLAAARAVIFAQMVDDPSAWPDLFPTEKAQEKERQRLFRIIEDLVKWENTTNEEVLERARAEIWRSWRRACAENADHPRAGELFNRYKLPAFHDPFAGGGALPLEAQRLGLEAFASDLNPVAVLINKAMIEIPPKFAGLPAVNPGTRSSRPLSLFPQPSHPLSPSPPPAGVGEERAGRQRSREHKFWHSRGYLPHLDQPGLIQSITFRLADSVPAEVIDNWRLELHLSGGEPASDPRCAELSKRIERYADQGKGACWLNDDRIASLVEQALLHFDGSRYQLLAWCIMPNHVHVLIETREGFPLGDIVHSWKSFTAKESNRLLNRKGEFWMPDYFDRYIRDAAHLENVIRYIEENPVKAGLCRLAEEWKWGSARRKKEMEEAGQGEMEEARAGQGEMEEERAGQGEMEEARAGRPRSEGLAEDVRYYGKWMRDEAEKRIGHLYPKIKVTAEMVKERPDLRPYLNQELTVIAWLWARTVKSPNPAFAEVEVPLVTSFMLSTKKGKEAYVEPAPGNAGAPPAYTGNAGVPPAYTFKVKVGKPKDPEAAKLGTTAGKRNAFRCLMSDVPIPYDYIRKEGKAGRMGTRLMAIVAEGDRGRIYLEPLKEHETVARKTKPEWKPETILPDNPRDFKTPNYGLTTYGDLFTPRQLVALTTFSDLVQEAMAEVKSDALAAGLADDGIGLDAGGQGARAYAEAVGVYLGIALSRLTDICNALCRWEVTKTQVRNLFGRQAIPMLWDFAENNVFGSAAGDYFISLSSMVKALLQLPASPTGLAEQMDAQNQVVSKDKLLSTDPPYYDNIGYADLSDFFYVWLRRSLRPVFPGLFATLAVPKAEELVATPYRHGGKEAAEIFFLDGMTLAMQRLVEQAHPAFPVTIYYAFKQSETTSESGTASTGWETFLDAVIRAGFTVNGTWPMRTELSNRMIGKDTNALASSIILVCRRRAEDAPTATRREFLTALQAELPAALAHLQRSNIAPVDLAQSSIGPGMAVFTRYSQVLDAAGSPMAVREALALINQTLDEVMAEQESDFDADSRWALAWFEQHGFEEGEYGTAETLSTAKNTSVSGMAEAGILASSRGKVRLLRPEELPAGWDPATDSRLTVWEAVHHLVQVLESGGESAAAGIAARLGSQAEVARELAYRLYTICERKKRAQEALAYNGLVQSWPEIVQLAARQHKDEPKQGTLFEN